MKINNKVMDTFKRNSDPYKALEELNDYMNENFNKNNSEIKEFYFVKREGMGEYLEIKTTHLTRNEV